MAASAAVKSGVLAGLLPLTGALQVGSGCGLEALTFEEFVRKYERQYLPDSEEYRRRKDLFDLRAVDIASHNCDDMSWKAQLNHFSDWTEAELQGLRGYKKTYVGSPAQQFAPGAAELHSEERNHGLVPDTFTWGHLDAITKATDQQSCGSCWAYAATAALNAHAEINNNTQRYSVAQIVACTPNPQQCGGSGGCDGATAELAYEYALTNGLKLEADFPARPGGAQAACPADQKAPDALLSTGIASKAVLMPDGSETHMLPDELRGSFSMGMLGWSKLPENKEKPLVRALVEYGPLAVAVAAGSDWNWYYHGILTPQGCDRTHVISHAVVLYGYGKAMSTKHGEVRYWHIKNSWGQNWGEGGMLRLQRLDKEDEECAWDNKPEVGSGCKGGPSKVWVCGSCGILYDAVMPMFRL
jgi:cathepsin L